MPKKRIIKECSKHGLVEFVWGDNRYRCVLCRRIGFIEARRRQKRRLVAEFGGICEICGYNKCYQALQFHHVDPTEKIFSIAEGGLYRSWEKVLNEAKKCILVCSNCHCEIENGITLVPKILIDRASSSFAG
jgi:hypothetical protein